MKKLDRRIIRTRKQLAAAMLSLLLTKDYDVITVQDITEAADLNRATFYLHYGSKEELLIAALEAKFDELVETINGQWSLAPDWNDDTDFRLVFEHAAEYAPLYKVLLGDKGRAHVINRIIDYTAQVQMSICTQLFPNIDVLSVPIELVNRHVAGSMYALLSWWLANDMPHSAEYMASAIHRLCMQGIFPIFAEAAVAMNASAATSAQAAAYIEAATQLDSANEHTS